MLVLSRKAGERINIGDNISVEIRRVSGNRVTLALHAPREIRILRGELVDAAQEFEIEMPEEASSTEPAPAQSARTEPAASESTNEPASHLSQDETATFNALPAAI